eukprot:901747-Prymnesium_polylepis.1
MVVRSVASKFKIPHRVWSGRPLRSATRRSSPSASRERTASGTATGTAGSSTSSATQSSPARRARRASSGQSGADTPQHETAGSLDYRREPERCLEMKPPCPWTIGERG